MDQQYVKKLEKAIDNYLSNITELQDKMAKEEEALQNCLKELRFHEITTEIETYQAYAKVLA